MGIGHFAWWGVAKGEKKKRKKQTCLLVAFTGPCGPTGLGTGVVLLPLAARA